MRRTSVAVSIAILAGTMAWSGCGREQPLSSSAGEEAPGPRLAKPIAERPPRTPSEEPVQSAGDSLVAGLPEPLVVSPGTATEEAPAPGTIHEAVAVVNVSDGDTPIAEDGEKPPPSDEPPVDVGTVPRPTEPLPLNPPGTIGIEDPIRQVVIVPQDGRPVPEDPEGPPLPVDGGPGTGLPEPLILPAGTIEVLPLTGSIHRAVVVATITRDGAPVAGAEVAFSRSVAGRNLDYRWSATTDGDGRAEVEIAVDPAGPYWRTGASGYYVARAVDPASGEAVGRWGSIPIDGGEEVALSLPAGGRAGVSPLSGAASKGVAEIRLDASSDGSRVEVGKGQILVVTLRENPSTGYRWEVAGTDGGILRRVGETEFRAESDLIGAPGASALRFRAENAGQTTLDLAYRRPWEQDAAPLKVLSIQVVVR